MYNVQDKYNRLIRRKFSHCSNVPQLIIQLYDLQPTATKSSQLQQHRWAHTLHVKTEWETLTEK